MTHGLNSVIRITHRDNQH